MASLDAVQASVRTRDVTHSLPTRAPRPTDGRHLTTSNAPPPLATSIKVSQNSLRPRSAVLVLSRPDRGPRRTTLAARPRRTEADKVSNESLRRTRREQRDVVTCSATAPPPELRSRTPRDTDVPGPKPESRSQRLASRPPAPTLRSSDSASAELRSRFVSPNDSQKSSFLHASPCQQRGMVFTCQLEVD